jgi:hypothetical protein
MRAQRARLCAATLRESRARPRMRALPASAYVGSASDTAEMLHARAARETFCGD